MLNQRISSNKYSYLKNPRLFAWLFIVFVSCNNSPKAEEYGFLAMLGNDTVSIEHVTRQGNSLISDEVDRFPRVHVRHTVIELNDDGSIKHLEMNIQTPSEPANQRTRKVIADVSNNQVHLSKTDSAGKVNRVFVTGGSIVVAHVPQMYSLYELYFAAARHAYTSKPSTNHTVQMRQFYIDREFDNFPLGRATVRLLDSNKEEVTHDWLSGTGEAIMNSNYQMLNYSGDRTTYKVTVTRLASPPDVKTTAERFKNLEARNGNVTQLSVRDSVYAKIGNTVITVDYSRPLLRGRILLGNVIPYDRVWRTGANAATQFTTSTAIKIAGMKVPAGAYTLWTVPHTNGADLIVNKQTGQWGTEYNGKQNLGIVKLTTQTEHTPVEEFTISIIPNADNKHGLLMLEWGTFKWKAPIEIE